MTILDFEAAKAARARTGTASPERLDVSELQRQTIESVAMLGKLFAKAAAAAQAMDRDRLVAAAGALASVTDDLQTSALQACESLKNWLPGGEAALADAPADSRADVCLLATIGVVASFAATAEAAIGVLNAIERCRR